MTARYIGMTVAAPQVLGSDVIGSSSGGTLAGGQLVQVVYDDTTFTSSPEGKQRLLAALGVILAKIERAKTWPIDSTS